MADRNPLYVLHLEAERVESTYHPLDGFRAAVAIPTRTTEKPDRAPLKASVYLDRKTVDGMLAEAGGDTVALGEALDAYCMSAADRRVRAVLAGEELPDADIAIEPKTPHGERAKAIAELVGRTRPDLEALHGPGWARVIIESELRAVFTDAAQKGYTAQRVEDDELRELGRWYREVLAPRLEYAPKPGDRFDEGTTFRMVDAESLAASDA